MDIYVALDLGYKEICLAVILMQKLEFIFYITVFFFFIAIRTLKTLHFGTSELDSSSKIHDPPSLLHAKYKQAQTD